MIRHLTAADFVAMPWKNGRGQTTEMIKVSRSDGSLLYRISLASVVEDGPFSLYPGVERNLTVVSGPGFDLTGAVNLRADPLVPVAFAGALAVSATGVSAPCEDFNVMTCARIPKPDVQVIRDALARPIKGRALVIFALEPVQVGPHPLARRDLLITDQAFTITSGPVVAVTLSL